MRSANPVRKDKLRVEKTSLLFLALCILVLVYLVVSHPLFF
jgi:hypothetical protein